MNDDGTREPIPAPAEAPSETPAEPLIAHRDPADDRSHPHGLLTRRRFLIAGAATGVGAATVTLGPTLSQESAPATPADTPEEAIEDVATVTGEHTGHMTEPAPNAQQGFSFFVPYQAAIIQAAAARLIPTDELGPGATEADVASFIDRQLFAELTFRGYRGWQYMLGPFLPGETTQGDQSGLPMRDRFRLGIQGMDSHAQQVYGRGFAELAPEEQDRILVDLEAGIPEDFPTVGVVTGGGDEVFVEAAERAIAGARGWFDLLLAYTFAGFFADPVQGGNRDMVGWKLIGFPGAHVGYADRILNYGEPFDGPYISLAQYQQQMSGGS